LTEFLPSRGRTRVTAPDVALGIIVLGGAVAMTGIYLDTAWHRTIGRDSFFIFPHTLVYGGGASIFFAALGAIAWATLRDSTVFGGPVPTLGRLRAPFGFALTAVGVLCVAGAAPVDAFWHWMWGKDVLIWSPPHLLLAFGGDLASLGVLCAVAAQRGRGVLARPWRWRLLMLMVLVDLIHRSHYVLAHYTMIPPTRTPDFYPFLAALGFPFILVAAERAVGRWAGTLAALLFVPVAVAMDLMLQAIDFERYTISPIVAVPALALSLVVSLRLASRAGAPAPGRAAARTTVTRARCDTPLLTGVLGGAAFALAFTVVETAWMAAVVGQPWPWGRVVAGLPRSLVAGAGSGWVGAVLGSFLMVVGGRGVGDVFGGRTRARRLGVGALALTVIGLLFTYQPQTYGPPMTVEELRLVSVETIKPQEAVFWEALLQEDWEDAPRVEVRSEGVIDGIPLPVGPAWCAATEAALLADLARLRFSLQINGTVVDLARYPVARVRDRSGAYCGWVGVVSTFQRASENRFLYVLEPTSADAARPARKTVDVKVVFKDP